MFSKIMMIVLVCIYQTHEFFMSFYIFVLIVYCFMCLLYTKNISVLLTKRKELYLLLFTIIMAEASLFRACIIGGI